MAGRSSWRHVRDAGSIRLGLWTRGFGPQWLPLATLGVNVVGCFIIGALFQWTIRRELHGTWWDVAIRVGFLGGLTPLAASAWTY